MRGISFPRILACLSILILACSHCFATSSRAKGGKVYLNEMLVLSLHSGKTADIANRARAVAQRLENLDSNTLLSVETEGKTARIVSGAGILLTVTPTEAAAQRQDPEVLANTWAKNIAKALSLLPLQLEGTSVKLPPGGRLSLKVLGPDFAGASITASDPDIVAVGKDVGILYLRGVRLGKAVVTITGATDTKTVDVDILPAAAAFPQTIEAQVTGDPTTADTLEGVIDGALRTKLQTRPGTEISYTVPKVKSLSMEDSVSVPIKVRATAPDAFAAEGEVTVVCRNVPIAYQSESELWYCNDPENIRKPQLLFANYLRGNTPVRLLYHHINESYSGLYLHVHASNESDAPIRVLIIPGESRPDKNPVLAGIVAGAEFLTNWVHYSGEIVTVPPHTDLPIALRRMSPGETASGLCYLKILGSGQSSLLLRADAKTADEVAVSGLNPTDNETPWRQQGFPKLRQDDIRRVVLSEHVYPKPFKEQEVNYRVGGKYGFVRIGQKPIQRSNGGTLDGNFGVIYTVKVNVDNPTDVASNVEVVFESSAGYTGALFIVDGRVIRTPLLQPKDERRIAQLRIPPGGHEEMTFMTMPLSGGSYPATITIRPEGD